MTDILKAGGNDAREKEIIIEEPHHSTCLTFFFLVKSLG